MVLEYMGREIPEWANVTVAPCGKDLGFYIGPAAGTRLWEEPTRKWTARAEAIACSRLAPSLGVPTYNQRALTTKSYVTQLAPPPKALFKVEKSLNQRVMHFSNNTVPVPFLFRGGKIGLPQFSSLKVLSYAARFRTARYTLTTVDENQALWKAAMDEHASLRMLSGEVLMLKHWDAPPLIDNVCEARLGFPHIVESLPQLAQTQLNTTTERTPARNCSPAWSGKRRISPQAVASKVLLSVLYPVSFAEQFARRLALWCSPLSQTPKETLAECIRCSLGYVSVCPKSVVVSVCKVWCDGVPTNFRMHKEKRKCIWGCDEMGSDRLLHYICCPKL